MFSMHSYLQFISFDHLAVLTSTTNSINFKSYEDLFLTHTMETDIVKLVVEVKSFGMSSDKFDKETGSSDGLQPKQADLSCVHALNELLLHEIRIVPSKHEADQY
ncbi:hypothetical protein Tco_0687691 [Tanacetum coccineum]